MIRKWIVCLLGLVLFSGCVIANPYLLRDNPNLVEPAKRLVEDYLEGQKKGESYAEAAPKYGSGVSVFYGLKEYRYEGMEVKTEVSILFYRIKAGNKMGGVTWGSFAFWFDYDKTMLQDRYEGLRIERVFDLD
ncbi:MAG: hypothetical protein P9L96_03295 [Candidatus Gygaella obscura]|nr:hypothetical protein [Candidatus Gygaella obscura]